MVYTIYSKENCKYCKLTKEFLNSKKLEFKEIILDPNNNDYVSIRDELINKTDHRTFPWIFEGDRFIGGYKELVASEDF